MKSLLSEAVGYCDHNVPESMHGYAIKTYCDAYRIAKINTTNRNIFFFFAGVVLTILFCLLAGFNFKAHSQDSVAFKVIHNPVYKDTVYYTLKNMETGEKVMSKCCCKPHPKGTIKMIARKDLVFDKPRP